MVFGKLVSGSEKNEQMQQVTGPKEETSISMTSVSTRMGTAASDKGRTGRVLHVCPGV